MVDDIKSWGKKPKSEPVSTDVVTNGNQQRDFEQNAAKAWGKTINE